MFLQVLQAFTLCPVVWIVRKIAKPYFAILPEDVAYFVHRNATGQRGCDLVSPMLGRILL